MGTQPSAATKGPTHMVDVRCRFRSNDGAALVSAAIEGQGLCLLLLTCSTIR